MFLFVVVRIIDFFLILDFSISVNIYLFIPSFLVIVIYHVIDWIAVVDAM